MPVAPGPRGDPARAQREAAILKPGTEASEDTEPASTSTLAPRGTPGALRPPGQEGSLCVVFSH